MKKILLLLFVLLLSCQMQAQETSTPKDSIILRRFFHNIDRGFKNMNHKAKTVAYNARQKYHDSPRATNTLNKRFSISINAGGNYYADFGPKYFPLDTGQFIIQREINYSSTAILDPHVSYTNVPGFSFHGGLVCAFQITKEFSVEGGLIYSSRRSKNIYSTDSKEINILYKYTNWTWSRYVYYKEVEFNTQSIEIPFYFCYTYKRFSSLIGTHLILVTIDHQRNTLIDNSFKTTNDILQPFARGSRATEYSIPSIKFRYLIKGKKLPVSIYCCADWLKARGWDFLTGFQIGIFSR